jgi:hypothetical protein
MPTKISDWTCSPPNGCGHTWEFLAHGDDVHPTFCPKCNNELSLKPVTTKINITTCHDPIVKKEVLKKRSVDHSRKLVQKEAGHRGSLPKDFGRRKLK